MPDPLLSSLCSICHVHPQKYRCPRCFVLTCSLPCIKRHKQWAQCNGVRDPTKYMKRADLATPKGIDHDYNYLTSIERELDCAEKNALSRGFVLEEEKGIKRRNPVKGETQLNAALERQRVIVTRAPKGMTRSKQNGTICSRKKTLQWTVEWVHPDGKRTMDKVWEGQCISTAYDDHLRYLDTSRPKKRRKSDQKQKDLVASAANDSSNVPVNDSTTGKHRNGPTTTPSSGKRKREEDTTNMNPNTEEEVSNTATAANLDNSEAVKPSFSSIPPPSNPPPPPPPPKDSPPSNNLTFHLHHPSLPSRHPVLIPLPPDAKLATSLTNRIVLEFPTIYVLHEHPDGKLPEGYVSEEEFFARAKKGLIEEVVVGGVGGDVVGEEGEVEEGEVDEGRLMEVLGRDLKEVVGGSL